jgi:nitroreductase/dihydropteridine reductase
MDVARLARTRHTCKAYDPTRKLSPALLEQLLGVLRHSPSSVNSQPWHFILAASEEGRQRIARATEHPVYAANTPKILNASHVIVFCARTDLGTDHLAALLAQEERDGRFPVPEAKATQNRSRNFYVGLHRFENKDTQHWMEKQLHLALGMLLFAAAALEVDATPIEGFDARRLGEELGLRKKGLVPVVLAALGYRSDGDFNAALPKSRLPAEEVISTI